MTQSERSMTLKRMQSMPSAKKNREMIENAESAYARYDKAMEALGYPNRIKENNADRTPTYDLYASVIAPDDYSPLWGATNEP